MPVAITAATPLHAALRTLCTGRHPTMLSPRGARSTPVRAVSEVPQGSSVRAASMRASVNALAISGAVVASCSRWRRLRSTSASPPTVLLLPARPVGQAAAVWGWSGH